MKYDNDREVGMQDRTMRYAVSHVSPSIDPYCKMKGLPCDMWYEPRRLPHQTYSRFGERLRSNVRSKKQPMTLTERFGCKGLYQQLKRPVPVIDCFLLRLSWNDHQVYCIFYAAVSLSSTIHITNVYFNAMIRVHRCVRYDDNGDYWTETQQSLHWKDRTFWSVDLLQLLPTISAEEDLRIETSYPFNEVTAVFLLNNPHYQVYFIFYIAVSLSSIIYVHIYPHQIVGQLTASIWNTLLSSSSSLYKPTAMHKSPSSLATKTWKVSLPGQDTWKQFLHFLGLGLPPPMGCFPSASHS